MTATNTDVDEKRIDAIAEILAFAAEDTQCLYYRTAFEEALNENSRISHVSVDIARLFDPERTALVVAMVRNGALVAVETSHNDGWLFTKARAARGIDNQENR